jgi:hypothetical protein
MKPKVAVMLVNYRRPADTIECIDSLKKLGYPNLDILCIENGSQDDSLERIRAAHPDVPIKVIEVNQGFLPAGKLCLAWALERGADYVWELNNDTVVFADTLDQLLKVAQSDPKIAAVGSVLYYHEAPEKVQAYGGGRVNLWTGTVWHVLEPGRVDYLTGASMLLNRKAIEEVSRFEDTFRLYFEDTDFCFRLRKKGWKITVAENAKVLHKESVSTKPGSPNYEKNFNESAVKFFKRHAPVPYIPIIRGIGWRLVRRVLKGRFPEAKAILGVLLRSPNLA